MYINCKKMQIIIIFCIFLYLTNHLFEVLKLVMHYYQQVNFLIVFDQWRHLFEKY